MPYDTATSARADVGCKSKENFNNLFLVAMRLGETPVLIPNTMVKTQTADGTALETKWESRWLPRLN